jgi:hypothetical protein
MPDYLKDGIRKGTGTGRVCGFCDAVVRKGEPCVTIKARVNAAITTIVVTDYVHPECARKAARMLLGAADECDGQGVA